LYVTGMGFLPAPEGSSGRKMDGYDFVRDDIEDWVPVYARVAAAMSKECELKL
jgi:hypothetical protein